MPGSVTAGQSQLAACLERLTRLHPRVIDLSLDRVVRLLDALGAPHTRLPPVVHVAGTNGKGSVIAYMAAALKAAGKEVHAYTSPHLVRFNERVVLNGAEASDDALCNALERAETANRGGDVTFFEVTTAAAFLLFAERPADYLLLETGLGGRLDATNVVETPKLCVVTPISLDHQSFLGDTISEIAGEKAGILKAGVPAVIGPQVDAARAVIETRASIVNAPLHLWERDWRIDPDGVFQGKRWNMPLPRPSLNGQHQVQNAVTAAAACELMDDPAVTPDAVAAGVAAARWPARLQELTGTLGLPDGWRLWLDGGHNPAAGRALADWAATRERAPHLIGAMLKIKDARTFLAPLAGKTASFVGIPMIANHDGYTPDELAGVATEVGIPVTATALNWRSAVDRVIADADEPGDILICGSLYLAGQVLGDLAQAHASTSG